jgi:hypothetical protein
VRESRRDIANLISVSISALAPRECPPRCLSHPGTRGQCNSRLHRGVLEAVPGRWPRRPGGVGHGLGDIAILCGDHFGSFHRLFTLGDEIGARETSVRPSIPGDVEWRELICKLRAFTPTEAYIR